jgi:hypothetical protein
MTIATTLSAITLGLIMFLGWGTLGVLSIREGENRAAGVAFGLAVLTSLPLFLAGSLPVAVK